MPVSEANRRDRFSVGLDRRGSPSIQPFVWVEMPCGFGATQIDLTLRRQFKLTERFSLQARGDLFNIFNHPNFGNSQNYLYSSPAVANPLFGQSMMTLARYLGSGGQGGGLNPLYQIGGPHSIQLALKPQTSVLNIRLHDARSAGSSCERKPNDFRSY